MSLLIIKMIRDLKETKGQMISLMIVVSLGVMLYSGINATFLNLNKASETYYETYKFADYFVQATAIPQEGVRRIEAMDAVTKADGRLVKELAITQSGIHGTVRLQTLPDVKKAKVNDVKLVQGRYYDRKSLQEVLVEEAFFNAHHLRIGMTLKPIYNGKPVPLVIIGVVKSPEYVYTLKDSGELMPDPLRFGILYIKDTLGQSLFSKAGTYNQVSILLNPDANLDQFKYDLEQVMKPYGLQTHFGREFQSSHAMLSEEMKGLKSVSGAFPSLFLMVAGIILYLMMGRMVEQQRSQIGVLKAFGFTDLQILLHYLSYALLTALIGSGIGAFFGVFLGQGMTLMENAYFHLPLDTMGIYPELVLPATGLSLIFCLIASLNACQKAFRLSPSEALRPKSPPIGQAILLEQWHSFWKPLSFAWKMVLRNVFRYKKRSLMTMTGIVFGAALLLVSFGMMDSVQFLINSQYETLMNYDVKVTLNRYLPKSEWDAFNRIKGVKGSEPLLETAFTFQNAGHKKTVPVIGLLPNAQMMRAINDNNQPLPLPLEGLFMPPKLAKALALDLPSPIIFKTALPNAQWQKAVITGDVQQFLGTSAYGTIETVSKALKHEPIANAFVLKTYTVADANQLKKTLSDWKGVLSVQTKADARENLEKNMEIMTASIGLLVILSGILSISVIYNVSTINIFERQRELATLKVMGFKDAEIRSVIFYENYLLTALSGLISLPVGHLLGQIMMQFYQTDAYSFVFKLNWVSFGYTIVLTAIFAGLSSVLLIRKIRHLDMVAVLKNIE